MSGEVQSRQKEHLEQRPKVRGYQTCSENSKEGSDGREGQRRRPGHL